MRWLTVPPLFACSLLLVMPAFAEGTQFTGTCNTIAWNANTESDLSGYRIYDRVSLSSVHTLKVSVGAQITSVSCAALGFNAGQHYVSITAFDTSGNASPFSADVPFVTIDVNQQINDLTVTVVNATDMTLSFTEVDNGLGAPANYDVRLATPTIGWGTASSVSAGTCSVPVAGTTIGATKTCTVTGLATTTAYQFQLVPFRGTLNINAIFGPLSNITGATTGGAPPSDTGRYTTFSDSFTRANDTAGLGSQWSGGYVDASVSRNLLNWQLNTNAARALVADGATGGMQTVNSTTFPNDQWAETTLKTFTAVDPARSYALLFVHATGPPVYSTYEVYVAKRGFSGETSLIAKRVNGVRTILIEESATTWVATDLARFDVKWNTATLTNDLKLYRNDALLLSATDAQLLSGRVGMGYWLSTGSALSNVEVETFKAGGFTAAGAVDTCGCDQH